MICPARVQIRSLKSLHLSCPSYHLHSPHSCHLPRPLWCRTPQTVAPPLWAGARHPTVGVAGGMIPARRHRACLMAPARVGVAHSHGTYRPRPRTGQTAVHATQAVLMIMTRAVIPRPTTPRPLQGIDEGIHEMIVHQTGKYRFFVKILIWVIDLFSVCKWKKISSFCYLCAKGPSINYVVSVGRGGG